MKKAIVILIVTGMLGWAIYDFVFASDEKIENESANDKDEIAEVTIGLNVGNMAPDFQLQTLSGEQAKLSDYRGSRVMINFWATWCPPCRAEMPDMEKFYQEKDVEILAINLTDTESSIKQIKDFVSEYQLTFPILLDEVIEVANTYAIQPIPTSYMVDSYGIIQFKTFGPLNFEQMVQEFEKME